MKRINNKGFAILECVIAMSIVVIITIGTISILESNKDNTIKFNDYSDARISADNSLEAFKYADTAEEAIKIFFEIKGLPDKLVHYGTDVKGTYKYKGDKEAEYNSEAWNLINLEIRNDQTDDELAGTKIYQYDDTSSLKVITYPNAKTPYVIVEVEYVYNTCNLTCRMKYYEAMAISEPQYAFVSIEDILDSQNYSMVTAVTQIPYKKITGENQGQDIYTEDIAYKFILNRCNAPEINSETKEVTNYNMTNASYIIKLKSKVSISKVFGTLLNDTNKVENYQEETDGPLWTKWTVTKHVLVSQNEGEQNYQDYVISVLKNDSTLKISGNFSIMEYDAGTGTSTLLPIEIEDSNGTKYYLEASQDYIQKNELCELINVTNIDGSSIGFEIEKEYRQIVNNNSEQQDSNNEAVNAETEFEYVIDDNGNKVVGRYLVKAFKNSSNMSSTTYRFHVSQGAKIVLSTIDDNTLTVDEINHNKYTYTKLEEDTQNPGTQILKASYTFTVKDVESGVIDITGTFDADTLLKLTVIAADTVETATKNHFQDYYFSASKTYSDANVYSVEGANSYYFESEYNKKVVEENNEIEETDAGSNPVEGEPETKVDETTGDDEEVPTQSDDFIDTIHVTIGKKESISKHTLTFNIGKFAKLKLDENEYLADASGRVTITNGNWSKAPSYVVSCTDGRISINDQSKFTYDGDFFFKRFTQDVVTGEGENKKTTTYYSDWYLNLSEEEQKYSWVYSEKGSYFTKNVSPEGTPDEEIVMESITSGEATSINQKVVSATELSKEEGKEAYHASISIEEYGIVVNQTSIEKTDIPVMAFTIVNSLIGYEDKTIEVTADDGLTKKTYLVAVTNDKKANLSASIKDVEDESGQTKIYDTSISKFKYSVIEIVDNVETEKTKTVTTTSIYLNKLVGGMTNAKYYITLNKGSKIYSIEEIGGKLVQNEALDRVLENLVPEKDIQPESEQTNTKTILSNDGHSYTITLEKIVDGQNTYSIQGDFDANDIVTIYVKAQDGEAQENIFKLIFNGSYEAASLVSKFNRPEFYAICTKNEEGHSTIFEIKKYIKGTIS